jgi:hypothetical protein
MTKNETHAARSLSPMQLGGRVASDEKTSHSWAKDTGVLIRLQLFSATPTTV